MAPARRPLPCGMSVNAALARCLGEIAQMLELLGADKFKVIAHDRAARVVEGLADDAAALAADRKRLLAIEGIGPRIADKIIEFCTTGAIAEHAELRAQVPAGLLGVLAVPGLGPKTVRLMWQERGVVDVDGLKRIIDDGSILTLPRMGAKSVEKIKASLAFAQTVQERLPLGLAMPAAEVFVERMKAVKGVERATFAGSLRRGKETIGDIDILVTTADPDAVVRAFTTMPEVYHVISAGESKASVRARVGHAQGKPAPGENLAAAGGPSIQVDLRVLPPASWGAALMYFTGSKEHNIRLRERAIKRGYTLNDWGLFPIDQEKSAPHLRGVKAVASREEADIYKVLGLPYLPPEVREDRGELELKETPRLVEVGDIKAELHAHTTGSDGEMTIAELANAARLRGFHAIAVTDHSKSAAIGRGLTAPRLREHLHAIKSTRELVDGIAILAGSEVDILADGRLDYDDDLLAELDVVVASPHVALTQDPAAATRRLIRAIENPFVRILGHPTGRLLNRRPGLSPDMAEVIAAARQHGVALEINAHWQRLDLRDSHVRAAVEAGCLIAIDCDVHHPADFDNLRYGVLTARRGWVRPEMCVNAWTPARLAAWLKSRDATAKPVEAPPAPKPRGAKPQRTK